MRKGLVIVQFSLSIFLIVSTGFIYFQLDYMKNLEMGFDQEAVLLISNNNDPIEEKSVLFKQLLRNIPNVKSVTSASGEPGGFHDWGDFRVDGLTQSVRLHTIFTDTEYLTTFDIETIAGRDFDREIRSDSVSGIMVNETALRAMGLTSEEAIGRKVKGSFWELDHRIIGVFRDYHFEGLKTEIEPLAIIAGLDERLFAVKMHAGHLRETVASIEQVYKELSPDFPMSSRFLDDTIAQQYAKEEQQAHIFSCFAILSVLLSSMGIFGLAAFSAQQRQKELSIRKVLGASVQQVILLISYEYLMLVILAAFVAVPTSWYFASSWLQRFAYRIQVMDHWLIFLTGGALTVLIAFLTISAKAYRTAATNPSEIIRNE